MNNEQKPQEQHTREVFADLGSSIQQLRHHHGLTVEQAAEQAELTPTRLEAIERGRLTTNLNTLTDHVERLGGRLAIIPEEHPDDPHCQFIEFEE